MSHSATFCARSSHGFLHFRPAQLREPRLLTFQNELMPNQANVTVKQIATATRPKPTRPAWYFVYSCARAIPPLAAITRKTRPVTSSHNWCATRPKARALVAAAFPAARRVRLRPACCLATRATTPNFRAAETLLTPSILTACGATMAETCDQRTDKRPRASKAWDDGNVFEGYPFSDAGLRAVEGWHAVHLDGRRFRTRRELHCFGRARISRLTGL